MKNILEPAAAYIRAVLERHERRDHMDLWTGEVVTVNAGAASATVKLRGEATATTCQYMGGFQLAIGNKVYVLARNRSYLIIGTATLV